MARRKTAPGDTTAVAYHVRTDQGPWTAADPMDIAVSRAKRGRQWRARTRMGLSDGSTMTVSRSGATPAIALAALDLVIVQERQRILAPETAVPTFGELIGWAVDRIKAGRDPNVKSTNSQRTYVGVATRWAEHPVPEADSTASGPRAPSRGPRPINQRSTPSAPTV